MFFSLPVISGTCFLLEQERCFSFKRKPLPLLIGMLLLFEYEHSFCSCGNVFFLENSRAFHFVLILLYFLKINFCPLDFGQRKFLRKNYVKSKRFV